MELLSDMTPSLEGPLASSLPTTHFDPPREFVEDLWDWSRQLGGPHVSIHSARLIPRLRTIAAARNAEQALITSALERVRAARARTSVALSNAMADLAVTGRFAFRTFTSLRPTEAGLLPRMLRAADLPVGITETEARVAITATLNRAYTVMWALRGAPSQRAALRPTLGWIAISGEDDPPHAPVNIPGTNDPMGEINIAGLSVPITLRAAIKLPTPLPPMPVSDIRSFPATTAWRQFDDLIRGSRATQYEELIVFVHGLGSRLEEGDAFKQELINTCSRRGRRVAVLSIDLPGFGYSSRIEHAAITRAGVARFDLGNPLTNSSFPYLTLFRDTLEILSGQIAGGYQFVIGGSLGGNMVLRLAANKQDARQILSSTLLRFACWSPASIWESWERARTAVMPWDQGVHVDVVKHEMVRRSRDSMNASENTGRRREWFDWIQRGSEFLGFRVAGWMPKQGVGRESLLYLSEIYSGEWRQTFWATSHEQLIFSHQEPLSPATGSGVPTWPFRTIARPLLIMAGGKDGGGPDSDFNPLNYYGNVDKVARESPTVPGQRLLLRGVGHSVHDERPRFLAQRICEFFFFWSDTRNEVKVTFVTGGDNLRGGNDNVHMVVLLRDGQEFRFTDVNGRNEWRDNSTHEVSRELPPHVQAANIVGIRLETTFGGGLFSDKWKLDSLSVAFRSRVTATWTPLLNFSGRPLIEFTSSRRTQEFRR